MASMPTSLSPEQLNALLNGPAGPPPGQVVPDFMNPQNLGDLTITIFAISILVSTLAVMARIYTKVRVMRSIAIEDCLIIIAWVSQIGEGIPSMLTLREGVGRHIWDVRLRMYLRALYYINITAIMYCVSVTFIKLSILFFYIRVFVSNRQANRGLYIAICTCMGVTIAFYLADMILEIFQCVPRRMIWNPFLAGGHCFNYALLFEASGIFNILSDFAILLLPIPAIWRLQLKRPKKIGLTALFATGLLACIASIVRTYYTWRIYQSGDVTWNICIMGMGTFAEMSIGILVSCLPTFPKLLQAIKAKNSFDLLVRFKSARNYKEVGTISSSEKFPTSENQLERV